ncbi:MAG: hypothetical protein KC478_12255 [Bacteriovoracaceae bacterium]|nr:hypothetical protein [Bacteriovoracaceae bacterium]
MDFLLILGTLTTFSIVQSIIGVGLLVFGTPTLMLMGNSFDETLSIVLPASICISFLQVIEPGVSTKEFKKEFNFLCVPFVFIGLLFVLISNININLNLLVGSMLLISGLIRFSPSVSQKLSSFILRHRKIYQVIMGTIHGLTNMGGGLLTIFSSSVHSKNKASTRAGVAYGYLLMGLIQYGLLLFLKPTLLSPLVFLYILVGGLSYLIIGKKIFFNTEEELFQKGITGIILFYGVMLIIKA